VATILVCFVTVNTITWSQEEKRSTLAPYLLLRQKLRILGGLIGNKIIDHISEDAKIGLIAVSGGTATGKSSTALEVEEYLVAGRGKEVVRIDLDWFLMARDDRLVLERCMKTGQKSDGHPSITWEIDRIDDILSKIIEFKYNNATELCLENELKGVYNGITGKTDKNMPPITIKKGSIVMIEGAFPLSEDNKKHFDASFFFDTSQKEAIRRVLERERKKSPDKRQPEEWLIKRYSLINDPLAGRNKVHGLRYYDYVVETTGAPLWHSVKTVSKYGIEFTYFGDTIVSVDKIVGTDKNEVRAALFEIARQIKSEYTLQTVIDTVKGAMLFTEAEKKEIIWDYKIIPEETLQPPTAFGQKDLGINNCRKLREYILIPAFQKLCDEILNQTATIQPLYAYVKKARSIGTKVHSEEERIYNKWFLPMFKDHFGKPWLGPEAPDISSFILVDYLYFLANVFAGHYTEGSDTYGMLNESKLEATVTYLKQRIETRQISSKGHNGIVMSLLEDILYANKFDSTRDFTEGAQIGCDQRIQLADVLCNVGMYGKVDMFIDNFGPELAANLQLAEYLINNDLAGTICVHIKPAPFVINDVWGTEENPQEPNIEAILQVLDKSDDSILIRLGSSLRNAIREKRLFFVRDEFVTYQPDYIYAQKELNEILKDSSCALFVGDYHYRKLLGHRRWPHSDNPDVISEVLSYIAPHVSVGIIRMVKSDLKLGVPADTLENGTVGMIQVAGAQINKIKMLTNPIVSIEKFSQPVTAAKIMPGIKDRFESITEGIYPRQLLNRMKEDGYNPIIIGYDHENLSNLPKIKKIYEAIRQVNPRQTIKVAYEIIPPIQLEYIKIFLRDECEYYQLGTIGGEIPSGQTEINLKSYRDKIQANGYHAEILALWLLDNGCDVISIEHENVKDWISDDSIYGDEEETFGHVRQSLRRPALTAIRRDIHGIKVIDRERADIILVGSAHALKYDLLLDRDGYRSFYSFLDTFSWEKLLNLWETAHSLYRQLNPDHVEYTSSLKESEAKSKPDTAKKEIATKIMDIMDEKNTVDIEIDLKSIDREISSRTHPFAVRETDPTKVEFSFRKSTMVGVNMQNVVKENITEPVDVRTDLALIPRTDLEKNLQEWALIIRSCGDLPVNFIFDSKDKDYERRAGSRLKEIVPEMKDRINVLQEGALKVVIRHVKNLDQIGQDEYPVAMAGENVSNGNVAVRDFNSAIKIGLIQTVLVQNKGKKGFNNLVGQVKSKLEEIYKACGVEVKIGDKEIKKFISENSTDRLEIAIRLALPPICRFPLKVLQSIHESNRMILEMV